MEESQNNSAMTIIVLSIIASLVIGGGIGYAFGASMTEDTPAAVATATPVAMMDGKSDGVTVGGAKMVRNKDIVDNAVNASNVTTVVSLVQLADLVDTLKSVGPFTVFAPNNAAFAALPSATVASLQQPENKATLAGILTYHVVSGTYTSADLAAMAAKGESIKTVQGGMLMPVMEGGMLKIKDGAGMSVSIETPDVISSNGVTHVVTGVLMNK